jgi:asparagine synthase (glutamine-hydrolysing)
MMADVRWTFLSGGIVFQFGGGIDGRASRPNPIQDVFLRLRRRGRFNELPLCEMVADNTDRPSKKSWCDRIRVGIIRNSSKHFGEPFADSSAIPTFIVSEFAARTVKGGALAAMAATNYSADTPACSRCSARAGWIGSTVAPLLMSWISARLPYSRTGRISVHDGRRNGLDRYFASGYSPYHMRSRLLRQSG